MAKADAGQLTLIEDHKENEPAKIDDLRERRTDELVIALVGPVGSGCSTSAKILERILRSTFKYHEVEYYHVSKLIEGSAELVGETWDKALEGTERVKKLQDIGNKLRSKFLDDYLIAKVIERIAEFRFNKGGLEKTIGDTYTPQPKRWAHIIDSLKNPAELTLLRQVYGDMLWVFGVFAPEDIRKDRLKNLEKWDESRLAELLARDTKEEWHFGQGVRDIFFQADFFVRNDRENNEKLTSTLQRHLNVIFGAPVHTPTIDESAMYSAHAAASRSACMSRQVGAAITSSDEELLGVGWNDVPKFGGGLYTAENGIDDHRCFKWGSRVCHNDERKDLLYTEIYEGLKGRGLLKDDTSLEQAREELRKTDVRQLIEYSRAVHAEMAALVSVARSGKPGVDGGTLYCTTFPCHSCARHLLAAGIIRVVYIEPYPKSLATDLHRDATSVSEKDEKIKMVLQQYEGVSPRNLLRVFKPTELSRKKDGRLIDFDPESAHPLGSVSVDDFSTHEKRVLSRLKEIEKPKS